LFDPLRLPKRLDLEIEADLYDRIEEMSIRSGRSIPEIIQGLISGAFPMNPAEKVFGDAISRSLSSDAAPTSLDAAAG
jgi:hypothetical protein